MILKKSSSMTLLVQQVEILLVEQVDDELNDLLDLKIFFEVCDEDNLNDILIDLIFLISFEVCEATNNRQDNNIEKNQKKKKV